MDKLLSFLSDKEIFVDSTSLMCGQKDFFVLDLLNLLEKNKKKINVISNIKDILLSKIKYSEIEKVSKEGLEVIELYEKENIINYIDTNNIIEALNDNSKKNLCVLIEDKNEAKRIFKSLNNKQIEFYKICEGKIIKWNVVEDNLMRKEAKMVMSNGAKLYINLVIDNSSSMKGEKIEKLKKAIESFDSKIKNNNLDKCIEYSVTIFSGFESKQFKNYDEPIVVDNIYAGGIPFVGIAIKNSIDALEKRIALATKKGENIYKPWTILLLNGENYGDITESANKIIEVMKAGRLTFFPFALSDNAFNPNLAMLKKIKPFTMVKDAMYDKLFEWIYNLAEKRVNTPNNQSFAIDPNTFEGWTIK